MSSKHDPENIKKVATSTPLRMPRALRPISSDEDEILLRRCPTPNTTWAIESPLGYTPEKTSKGLPERHEEEPAAAGPSSEGPAAAEPSVAEPATKRKERKRFLKRNELRSRKPYGDHGGRPIPVNRKVATSTPLRMPRALRPISSDEDEILLRRCPTPNTTWAIESPLGYTPEKTSEGLPERHEEGAAAAGPSSEGLAAAEPSVAEPATKRKERKRFLKRNEMDMEDVNRREGEERA